jgi:hypothetical protein
MITNIESDNKNISPANSSSYASSNLSEGLTAYAVGFTDKTNIDEQLEFIAPSVPSARVFEFRSLGESQSIISEDDDERAPGADFKIVTFKGSKTLGKLKNKGLTYVIDEDDRSMSDEQAVALLLRRIRMNELRRAFAVLDANDASAGAVWSPTTATNPLKDFRTAIEASATAAGFQPNRIAMGGLAASYFWSALEFNTGALSGIKTLADAAMRLEVDEIRTIKNMYATKKTTGAKTAALGAVAYVFYAENGLSVEDPSAIKRFVGNTSAGGKYAVYIEKKNKLTYITVEHYSNVIATGGLGIRKIVPTQS